MASAIAETAAAWARIVRSYMRDGKSYGEIGSEATVAVTYRGFRHGPPGVFLIHIRTGNAIFLGGFPCIAVTEALVRFAGAAALKAPLGYAVRIVAYNHAHGFPFTVAERIGLG